MVARSMLRPLHRGGSGWKGRHKTLRERMHRWLAGEYVALWVEAKAAAAVLAAKWAKGGPVRDARCAKHCKCVARASAGNYSAAAKVLAPGLGLAPYSPATLEALKALHPEAVEPLEVPADLWRQLPLMSMRSWGP